MLTAKRRVKQVAARNAERAEDSLFNHRLNASTRGRVQKNAGGENFLLARGTVSAII
jgi:hypothetical protein